MSIELTPFNDARKLLMSVELKPVQGTRFQPTDFLISEPHPTRPVTRRACS